MFIFCIGACALFVCCGGNSDSTINNVIVNNDNMEEIRKYIEDNNLDAKSTESGLHYVIEKEGNGEHPTLSDRVEVHYHGYFTDGKVFDSSVDRGESISFGLNQVIAGWQEGIPLFSKGGKGKLIIPSNLGYGSRDSGPIPGNSVLVFDVELINF